MAYDTETDPNQSHQMPPGVAERDLSALLWVESNNISTNCASTESLRDFRKIFDCLRQPALIHSEYDQDAASLQDFSDQER